LAKGELYIQQISCPMVESHIISLNQRIKRKPSRIFRQITSKIRLLPSFIIFGAPRCGTTSLYNYLSEHPAIVPALSKEIGFFELNFQHGINWYKLFFPTIFSKYQIKKELRNEIITGEATANYIHHPRVPARIKKHLPNIKLILLLRNPVDRSYSQYYKLVKLGREKLSFKEALKIEPERIRGETEKMIQNDNYYSLNYHNFSYLTAGIYVDRLELWFKSFPKDQILILRSEDLYENPELIYKQTLEFLELSNFKLSSYNRFNYYNDQPKMDNTIRQKLIDYYKPHNQRLYKLLNRDFNWDK